MFLCFACLIVVTCLQLSAVECLDAYPSEPLVIVWDSPYFFIVFCKLLHTKSEYGRWEVRLVPITELVPYFMDSHDRIRVLLDHLVCELFKLVVLLLVDPSCFFDLLRIRNGCSRLSMVQEDPMPILRAFLEFCLRTSDPSEISFPSTVPRTTRDMEIRASQRLIRTG